MCVRVCVSVCVCVYISVCACVCVCDLCGFLYVSAFGSGFLSLGRCEEFSLVHFLIKPVSGLCVCVCVCLAVTHTHTHTHIHTHAHKHTRAHRHTHNSLCLFALYTQAHHTCTQALDESRSVSNMGISVYNKLGEDPILGIQKANVMRIDAALLYELLSYMVSIHA